MTGGKGNGPRSERKPIAGAGKTGAALCPACGLGKPEWSYFCLGCFCKLPVGTRFSLSAMTPDRRTTAYTALRILQQLEADRKAAESGFLFEVPKNGG